MSKISSIVAPSIVEMSVGRTICCKTASAGVVAHLTRVTLYDRVDIRYKKSFDSFCLLSVLLASSTSYSHGRRARESECVLCASSRSITGIQKNRRSEFPYESAVCSRMKEAISVLSVAPPTSRQSMWFAPGIVTKRRALAARA
jgi:hypothetical protein